MCYDSEQDGCEIEAFAEKCFGWSFGAIKFTVVFKIREVGLSEACN